MKSAFKYLVFLTSCIFIQICLVQGQSKDINASQDGTPQPIPSNSTVDPPTSATPPNTTTTTPTTPPPTTPPPTTPPPTTPPTTTSTSTSTPAPTTPTTPPSTSTATPVPTPTKPSPSPAPTHSPTLAPTSQPPHDRRFDAESFVGGMVLAFGLMAIGFVSWKFYMSRQENYYHTL